MTPAPERIPPEANALRRARGSHVKPSGKIRKYAFLPSMNGKDRDGLSVSIETPNLRELHRARYDGPEYRTCCITALSIRSIQPLDVRPDPDVEDAAHALIVGIPDVTLGDEEIARANYIADELAKRARPYTFPPAE